MRRSMLYLEQQEKPLDGNQSIEYLDEELLRGGRNEVEDFFYPNAISCLLSLYHIKYEELKNNKKNNINPRIVWEDISKQMNESFFHFTAEQIQKKFKQLRSQYLAIRSQQDARRFHYFVEFHNIYQDENIEFSLSVVSKKNYSLKNVTHFDEFLLEDLKECLRLDNFWDKIEVDESDEEKSPRKPMSALNGGDVAINSDETHSQDINFKESSSSSTINTRGVDKTPTKSRKRSYPEGLGGNHTAEQNDIDGVVKKMTLAEYNDHQERRHRELMAMKEKSLRMQSEAMEIQRQLLEQLINRNE